MFLSWRLCSTQKPGKNLEIFLELKSGKTQPPSSYFPPLYMQILVKKKFPVLCQTQKKAFFSIKSYPPSHFQPIAFVGNKSKTRNLGSLGFDAKGR